MTNYKLEDYEVRGTSSTSIINNPAIGTTKTDTILPDLKKVPRTKSMEAIRKLTLGKNSPESLEKDNQLKHSKYEIKITKGKPSPMAYGVLIDILDKALKEKTDKVIYSPQELLESCSKHIDKNGISRGVQAKTKEKAKEAIELLRSMRINIKENDGKTIQDGQVLASWGKNEENNSSEYLIQINPFLIKSLTTTFEKEKRISPKYYFVNLIAMMNLDHKKERIELAILDKFCELWTGNKKDRIGKISLNSLVEYIHGKNWRKLKNIKRDVYEAIPKALLNLKKQGYIETFKTDYPNIFSKTPTTPKQKEDWLTTILSIPATKEHREIFKYALPNGENALPNGENALPNGENALPNGEI